MTIKYGLVKKYNQICYLKLLHFDDFQIFYIEKRGSKVYISTESCYNNIKDYTMLLPLLKDLNIKYEKCNAEFCLELKISTEDRKRLTVYCQMIGDLVFTKQ